MMPIKRGTAARLGLDLPLLPPPPTPAAVSLAQVMEQVRRNVESVGVDEIWLAEKAAPHPCRDCGMPTRSVDGYCRIHSEAMSNVPVEHECNPPEPTGLGRVVVDWSCPACGRYWRRKSQVGDLSLPTWTEWRP